MDSIDITMQQLGSDKVPKPAINQLIKDLRGKKCLYFYICQQWKSRKVTSEKMLREVTSHKRGVTSPKRGHLNQTGGNNPIFKEFCAANGLPTVKSPNWTRFQVDLALDYHSYWKWHEQKLPETIWAMQIATVSPHCITGWPWVAKEPEKGCPLIHLLLKLI